METRLKTFFIMNIQLASSFPGQIACHGVIWEYFDQLKVPLKVIARFCTSKSYQTLFRAFKGFITVSF